MIPRLAPRPAFQELVPFAGRPAADTIARRINGERLVLLGWARAILLQLAHPLIAAGVYEHSGFRDTPLAAVSRLHHTVGAMLALTFGDDEARAGTLERIRAIHRRVNGHLQVNAGPFPAGTRYSAEDPDLVLWVHVTLIDSVFRVYDTLVGEISSHERDAYCEQAASVALDLGARDADVPRTWAATRQHLARVFEAGTLAVTPQAAELGRALISPKFAWAVAPVARANRLFTLGTLPEPIRAQYGFRWNGNDERAMRNAMRWLRRVRRYAPDVAALWPAARRTR
jgi:uncharacterized protein (DUF2236 family)